MLYNFGTEGVSYEMQDGKPVYTSLITNNPDGLTMAQAMSYYIGASHMGGGFVQDLDYYNQYLARQQQRDGEGVENQIFFHDDDGFAHKVAPRAAVVFLFFGKRRQCRRRSSEGWR